MNAIESIGTLSYEAKARLSNMCLISHEDNERLSNLCRKSFPMEVEVDYYNLPTAGGKKASEIVYAGKYGCYMHDDRHLIMHYSVLCVLIGADGWEVRAWDPVAQEVIVHNACAGRVIMLNIRQPHALQFENGEHADGWAAAAWNFKTAKGAKAFVKRIGKSALV